MITPEDCKGEIEPITSLPTFVKNLVETLAVTDDITFRGTLIDQLRTVDISNCCVGTTDFSVKPGTQKYDELVAAGWNAANDFLENYQSPKERVSGIRKRFREFFGW